MFPPSCARERPLEGALREENDDGAGQSNQGAGASTTKEAIMSWQQDALQGGFRWGFSSSIVATRAVLIGPTTPRGPRRVKSNEKAETEETGAGIIERPHEEF